ncbi:hypothetical protein FF1_020906 [Malus domestica]
MTFAFKVKVPKTSRRVALKIIPKRTGSPSPERSSSSLAQTRTNNIGYTVRSESQNYDCFSETSHIVLISLLILVHRARA